MTTSQDAVTLSTESLFKEAVHRLDELIEKGVSELTWSNRERWWRIVHDAALTDLPKSDRIILDTPIARTPRDALSRDEVLLRQDKRRIHRALSHAMQKVKRMFKTLRLSKLLIVSAWCLAL